MLDQPTLKALITDCINNASGLRIRRFDASVPLWHCETPVGNVFMLGFHIEQIGNCFWLNIEFAEHVDISQNTWGTFDQFATMLMTVNGALAHIAYAMRTRAGYTLSSFSWQIKDMVYLRGLIEQVQP